MESFPCCCQTRQGSRRVRSNGQTTLHIWTHTTICLNSSIGVPCFETEQHHHPPELQTRQSISKGQPAHRQPSHHWKAHNFSECKLCELNKASHSDLLVSGRSAYPDAVVLVVRQGGGRVVLQRDVTVAHVERVVHVAAYQLNSDEIL